MRPLSVLRLVEQLILEARGTGIDTSAGELFNHSVWARDRSISSFDLLPERPGVARQSILTLARLQGTRRTIRSEEEPGRIHNELRDLRRWRAPWRLKAPFGLVLAELWGGSPRGYITYFGSDSTPLFISLVAAYAKLGPDILDELVVRRDGSAASIGQAVCEAGRWIVSHLTADGLVEVPKHNVFSLPPQIWRDSPTSNFDEHGRMANVVEPMAYLDVQALCADALEDAAALIQIRAGHEAVWPDALAAEARRIREATQRTFWMEDEAYYAFAADRGAGGERRLLRAVQSNAGWLLATRFFDAMPAADKERCVGGVVRTLFSADLLTPAGVRGRALRHHDPTFRNYHEDVWPMDTFMIARGLRRQGFHELADELEARLLNTAAALGGAWEFVVVDDGGRVVDPRLGEAEARRLHPDAHAIATEMAPEADIGWTATALLRSKRDRVARVREARHERRTGARTGDAAAPAARARSAGERTDPAAPRTHPAARDPWIGALTAEILARTGTTAAARSRSDVAVAAFPISPSYLDQAAGLRRSAGVIIVQGFGRVLPLSVVRRARGSLRRVSSSARRGA